MYVTFLDQRDGDVSEAARRQHYIFTHTYIHITQRNEHELLSREPALSTYPAPLSLTEDVGSLRAELLRQPHVVLTQRHVDHIWPEHRLPHRHTDTDTPQIHTYF